ncbi:MAG: hypothetical protein C4537_06380 [Acholeplasma sp.]|jgi:hypothetical protein|nr:MAG: hypothetical protein C4537_06380 [Acholeplasma sp.]
MKQVLGVKSSGNIGNDVFALIILGLLGGVLLYLKGDYSDETQRLLVIFVPIFILYLIIDIIIQSKKPSSMITYDGNNLYLHYTKRTETIPLDQITSAIPRRTHSRMMNYSFGKIIIYTLNGEFRIGVISNVESVCVELMNIVRKSKEKPAIE